MLPAIATLPINEFPAIPPSFSRVVQLAYNLWWSWNSSGRNLWSNLDPVGWQRTPNPIDLISSIDRTRWLVMEQIEAIQDRYQTALTRFDRYMNEPDTWYTARPQRLPGPVAYVCTEFGVHDSLPFYSGGLGILAGDHAKSASDLGLPLIGVGLLYRRGYFRQEIEAEGDQQHFYPTLDVRRLPILPVAAPTGGQLKIDIEFPGRTVSVGVWKLQVGRIPLLLLDSDLPENDDGDRPITHTLYVRGREMRFCQELILGVGAVRAIDALGIAPAVWHVNEGHAAMSVLERTRQLCRHGIGFEQAMDEVRRRTLFTLHTPVPAGNEVFEASLASRYTKPWADALGLDQAGLGKLASSRGDPNEFDLGALAIRHAAITNGVSVRHAEVATHDWQHLIGGPAIAVTNGVHTPSWIGRDAERMLTGVFGPEWATEILDRPDAIELLRRVPDQTIWSAHQTRKELLTRFVRSRLRRQLARHGVSPDELRAVDGILPADVLTIGFARRFATYKRATLMFSDWHRLVRILANEERPVHVIFAGKAHPADRPAQHLIRHIIELSRTPELKGRVFFLEDYEAKVARYMVQGCDIWANNPRPPMEASGTSGMKAAINGTLNLSVLDGWWMEGYNGKNGWKFGSPDGHDNHDHQDSLDAQSFYEVLEAEVVPLYYDRGPDGIPHGWVETMRESMISTLVSFSTHRMVKAYAENAYYPLSAIT